MHVVDEEADASVGGDDCCCCSTRLVVVAVVVLLPEAFTPALLVIATVDALL